MNVAIIVYLVIGVISATGTVIVIMPLIKKRKEKNPCVNVLAQASAGFVFAVLVWPVTILSNIMPECEMKEQLLYKLSYLCGHAEGRAQRFVDRRRKKKEEK